MRRSCDCLTTFARTLLSLICSQFCREVCGFVAIGSQFSLIYLANMLCSKTIVTKLRGVGDKFATPAMTLRSNCEEFCRIKFLNMFKIFATTLRHLATLARKLRITGDCFETALRPSHDVCRQLSQNSRSPVR